MTFTTRLLGVLTTTLLTASLMAAPATAGPPPGVVPTAGNTTTARVTKIVDGDTIRTTKGTIRLVGIDTPERGRCNAAKATAKTRKLVPVGSRVTLTRPEGNNNTDRYGRYLRYVSRNGVDVGGALIKAGLADARYDSRDGYPRHAKQARYRSLGRPLPRQAVHRAPAAGQGRRTPTPGAGRTGRTGPASTTRAGGTPRSTAPPRSPSDPRRGTRTRRTPSSRAAHRTRERCPTRPLSRGADRTRPDDLIPVSPVRLPLTSGGDARTPPRSRTPNPEPGAAPSPARVRHEVRGSRRPWVGPHHRAEVHLICARAGQAIVDPRRIILRLWERAHGPQTENWRREFVHRPEVDQLIALGNGRLALRAIANNGTLDDAVAEATKRAARDPNAGAGEATPATVEEATGQALASKVSAMLATAESSLVTAESRLKSPASEAALRLAEDAITEAEHAIEAD